MLKDAQERKEMKVIVEAMEHKEFKEKREIEV